MRPFVKKILRGEADAYEIKRRFAALVRRNLPPSVGRYLPVAEASALSPSDGLGWLRRNVQLSKFLFTSPLDEELETYPPDYKPAIRVAGEKLPVPPPRVRPGYAPDNDRLYLDWGKTDHDFILDIIRKHRGLERDLAVLDWGCSSGRVLRHFYAEHEELGWRLHGTDVQAFLIEWMRQNFPPEIEVLSASTLPHLPYKDDSLDVIYGISVFTHTKYLWDAWLAEFRRVLKPGGLVIQTVQCEHAWRFYHDHRHLDWVRNGHPASMLSQPNMTKDYFLYGDTLDSQTFFKEDVIKRYWGRIMPVVDFLPPQQGQYQNWIVLRG